MLPSNIVFTCDGASIPERSTWFHKTKLAPFEAVCSKFFLFIEPFHHNLPELATISIDRNPSWGGVKKSSVQQLQLSFSVQSVGLPKNRIVFVKNTSTILILPSANRCWSKICPYYNPLKLKMMQLIILGKCAGY